MFYLITNFLVHFNYQLLSQVRISGPIAAIMVKNPKNMLAIKAHTLCVFLNINMKIIKSHIQKLKNIFVIVPRTLAGFAPLLKKEINIKRAIKPITG